MTADRSEPAVRPSFVRVTELDHPQDFVEFVAQAPKFENKYKGFLSLFKSKQKAVRARLSSADPTTVVNSCGDKFISSKRYVQTAKRMYSVFI